MIGGGQKAPAEAGQPRVGQIMPLQLTQSDLSEHSQIKSLIYASLRLLVDTMESYP
jgi:hypothetical protein